ncbi:MAG: diguanylate cyclase, partial [Bacteroidales bacterium]
KQLLCGADAVQMVSAFYKHGISYIARVNMDLKKWMETKNYKTLQDFKGSIHSDPNNTALFERTQFMKRTTGLNS